MVILFLLGLGAATPLPYGAGISLHASRCAEFITTEQCVTRSLFGPCYAKNLFTIPCDLRKKTEGYNSFFQEISVPTFPAQLASPAFFFIHAKYH